MKKRVNILLYAILALSLLLAACRDVNPPVPDVPVPSDTIPSSEPSDTIPAKQEDEWHVQIENLTLREKVGQLFNVRLEQMTNSGSGVTMVSGLFRQNFAQYPAGGFTLFAKNISYGKQLSELTVDLHNLGSYPLICIDEEGGAVARIGNNSNFSVTRYDNMYTIGQTGDAENAYEAGSTIGTYLHQYDIDVDFAPVADVWTNPQNKVIGKRAFSDDPNVVASMTTRFYDGLADHRVVGCYKHFPGHGDTGTDSHYGYAETTKTWAEMQACELIPFSSGIEHGIEMMMAAHISCPNVTGSTRPTTVSYTLLTEKLRQEMGYQGIIVTDALEMKALTSQYTAEEACLLALEAGADILLIPADYYKAFDAVVKAVEEGRISEQRIDQSVERILALKRKILTRKGLL